MPTKRRRIMRGSTRLSLADFTIADLLAFIAGWSVPETDFARNRSRWQTWEEYMSDYAAVRDELMASTWCRSADGAPLEPPVAETFYQQERDRA